MYLPQHFREDRLDVQHALMRQHPLGLLVSSGASGLVANPIPFVLDAQAGPNGTLRCHLARANPQWRDLAEAEQCLVVFQATDAYITPSWYETKRQTGKVVPTWNYATVHAWGPPRIVEDAGWLKTNVEQLTNAHEGPRHESWKVDDAPAPYIAAMLRGIVGVEIEIARIEGKWKVSQNRSEGDRTAVADGLAGEGRSVDAALVRERGQ